MAEEIKSQRSVAKRKVTTCLRKLNSSLQLGAASSKLSVEASNPEDHFDQLNDLHLDYEEITETEDKNYLTAITEEFNSCMKSYYLSIKEEKKIENQREASPMLACIERGFAKMELNLERLKNVNTPDVNMHAIEVDKSILENDTQALLQDVQKVSKLMDASDLQSRLDLLLVRSDRVKRNVEIFIKEKEHSSRDKITTSESQGLPSCSETDKLSTGT